MPDLIQSPSPDEYAPYYAQYVRRVPQGDIFTILDEQILQFQQALGSLSDDDGLYRFGPDEWSIKEVVGHLCDCERVFTYRAFAFARSEVAALPGFDQEDYVREANYDRRTLADLLQELTTLRQATLLTFRTLTPEVSERRGTASGATVSVRALLYILAGHADLHLESLRTEYLAHLADAPQQSTSPLPAD